MKILVLNGSPKGRKSVTMQYVHYIQKVHPEHTLKIINVAQRIKRIEREQKVFDEILEEVRSSDGVLWAFPLYILLVCSQYKRFIELVFERGAKDIFANKVAASLSTSIHFYDHFAHNYMRAVCDDLNMRYVGFFSADMYDLLTEAGREKLTLFAAEFFASIEQALPAVRRYPPLPLPVNGYEAGDVENPVDTGGKKVVILTDATQDQKNLANMVTRLKACFAGNAEVINLHDIDIKGGCQGCLRCAPDNECAYAGKDGYIDFYNAKVKTADLLVFAATVTDRNLSSKWRQYFDRSFFNTHSPSLMGKQCAVLLSGPSSHAPNLTEFFGAYAEFQLANLVDIVTDESQSPSAIDDAIMVLARRMVRFAASGYVRPKTFLGYGGYKVFRDDIWGRLRSVFQRDHKVYRRLGLYDFPQKDWKVRLRNIFLVPITRIPAVRRRFRNQIKDEMIRAFSKVLEGVEAQ